MLRRDRAVLLVLALLILLPAVGEGQQVGLINFVNGTPYNWRLVQQNSGPGWRFPAVITAGSTATIDLESWLPFQTASGNATYSVGDTGLSFHVDTDLAWGYYSLSADLTNLSTPGDPQGIVDLGSEPILSLSNPSIQFILAGQAGRFTVNPLLPNAWMHENLDVLGSRSLRDLCIPGSHDAGMSLITGGTIGGRECNTLTQRKNVFEQLSAGVRYFDIRPVLHNGVFVTGHYSCFSVLGWRTCQGSTGEYLADIINEINDYTADNPELVVLNLSHDLNTDAAPNRDFTSAEWCSLLTHLQGLNHRFLLPDSSMDLTTLTLSDFISNGPAVVVVGRPNSGISLNDLRCPFEPTAEGFSASENFPIYDSYANTDDVDIMQQDQRKKLYGERPGWPFVLSWTLTLQGDFDNAVCDLKPILYLASLTRTPLYQNVLSASNYRTYPNVLYIDDVESNDIAALAMAVNNKVQWDGPKGYVLYRGLGADTGIYVAYPPDSNLTNGSAWSLTRMSTAINTSDTPAAVYYTGGLHVLYKGSGNDSRIYIAQPAGGNILDGDSWSAQPLNPAINTSAAPAVAVLNDATGQPQLYMLYKGAGGDANIFISRSTGIVSDGSSWIADRLNSGINTSATPAVASFNNTLYLFYKGAGGDANIYIAHPTGDIMQGSAWSYARLNPGINTTAAPSVVVYKGVLYMFYKGFGPDTNIYVARSTGEDIMEGTTWTYTRLNPGINTTVAPKPVVIGDSLYLYYKGSGDSNIWIARPQGEDLSDGNAWTWERLNTAINTSVGPGAAGM